MSVTLVRKALGNKHCRLLLLCLAHFCYLSIGAAVFGAIEGPGEEESAAAMKKLRSEFFNRSSRCLSDSQLEEFIVKVIEANSRGVSSARNVTFDPNWNFGASLFFAASVLTTIGYGHVAPLSDSGKVFCIVYALIGLPLTIVLMTAVVQRLMVPSLAVLHRLDRWGRGWASAARQALAVRLLHLAALCTLVFVLACIIPSAILMTTEKEWDYFDAMYYCFITLLTVGLGDYVPGDQPDQRDRGLYKVAAAMFLFFGLALMMLVLATVQRIPQLNLGHHFYVETKRVDSEHRLLIDQLNRESHSGGGGCTSGGISIILSTGGSLSADPRVSMHYNAADFE